jgi:hypothetical protein
VTATVVRYEPRGGARELMLARESEVLIAGPAGTGKSLAMLFKLHLTALAVSGLRSLLVRQTQVSLTATTLTIFERFVVGASLAAGEVSWFGGSTRLPPAYRYANGSTMTVGGMDKPDKFLSSDYDRIAVDEGTEMALAGLEILITRLRSQAPTYRQIIVACNPAHPTHFLHQRAQRGTMRMILSRHRDNPAYVNRNGSITERGQEYFALLDRLTGVRRLRLLDGIWAAAEGIVYETYDPAIHEVPEDAVFPAEWTRYWSVDFGYTNPFVCQCWVEDPDGRLILEWEVYRTQRLVEDHAVTILDQVSYLDPDYVHHGEHSRRAHEGRVWTGPEPAAIICDHDAEDRATLERHVGRTTKAAWKTVSDGIQYVQARLKLQADGRPRLQLRKNAVVEVDHSLADRGKPTCTAEEFPAYLWKLKPGVVARLSGDQKDEPEKENDHGMDTTRYMVSDRDAKIRGSIRWL